MGIRLHLCGRLAIEGALGVVDERQLPGRQGRLALTRLGLDRHPISVDRLADAVWGEDAPFEASGALASLVSKLRTALRGALAVSMAEQAVDLDPLHEPAWRTLIRAHVADGNRAAAMQAYERCRTTLADELGAAPGPEIEALRPR